MMMTASRNPTNRKKTARPQARKKPGSRSDTGGKRKISATERWMLISRKVYQRAQQRGFMGGDPLEDLSEAIREIDDTYVTDVGGLLSLTDPAELYEQFQSLFASYGLGKRGLDRLLEMNRDALEKLAASNRQLVNGVAERTARQTSLLRDAAEDAMQTLQAIAGSAVHRGSPRHLPGTPRQALKTLLSSLKGLADAADEYAEDERSPKQARTSIDSEGIEIHGAVVKAYDGMSPAELADAPVSALRGISQVSGGKLASTLGLAAIRDMAESRLLEQAEGIVTLADEGTGRPGRRSAGHGGKSLARLVDEPVDRLPGITARQARVLGETIRVRTIRDLADNKFFRVARAIAALADLES
jgi:hypothetical protein